MAHSIEQEVRRFISETFLFGRDADEVDRSDSLLKRGIIDSTGVLELVSFVEREFEIRVDDDELTPSNFDSIDRLVNFIERKGAPALREGIDDVARRCA